MLNLVLKFLHCKPLLIVLKLISHSLSSLHSSDLRNLGVSHIILFYTYILRKQIHFTRVERLKSIEGKFCVESELEMEDLLEDLGKVLKAAYMLIQKQENKEKKSKIY